ncbi:MAG: hypothetical protein WCB31_05670 [Nitrososphaeraceae archaeon]|jgi:hypothetical protein
MLDQINTENIPNTTWCPLCLEVGISVQLGPRLYKKEELIDGELPHDSFDWLECRDCGHIVEDYFN